jgi:hypothetical protein
MSQIAELYGQDLAAWIDDLNPTLHLEGKSAAGGLGVGRGGEELINLREGSQVGALGFVYI